MPIGKPLADEVTWVRGLLYGKEGTGKSTDIARLSRLGPTLIINAEGGFKKEALAQHGVIVKNIEVWPENADELSYEFIEETATELGSQLRANPGCYVGVGIDSSTELHMRFLKQASKASLTRAAMQGKSRDRFNISVEDHGAASQMNRDMIRLFRDQPVHVFATALERRDTDQETGMVSYGPALGPSAARDLMGVVDVLGIKTVEKLGSEEFWIGTFAPVGVRRGKDRFGLLPRRMVNPHADRIIAYVNGELTKETDPEQERARLALKGESAAVEEKVDATAEETPKDVEADSVAVPEEPAAAEG